VDERTLRVPTLVRRRRLASVDDVFVDQVSMPDDVRTVTLPDD